MPASGQRTHIQHSHIERYLHRVPNSTPIYLKLYRNMCVVHVCTSVFRVLFSFYYLIVIKVELILFIQLHTLEITHKFFFKYIFHLKRVQVCFYFKYRRVNYCYIAASLSRCRWSPYMKLLTFIFRYIKFSMRCF